MNQVSSDITVSARLVTPGYSVGARLISVLRRLVCMAAHVTTAFLDTYALVTKVSKVNDCNN